MRTILSCLAVMILFAQHSYAQMANTEPDRSPMDMSYHPMGYPILKFQASNVAATPKARVIYSRPQKNGRTIFGDIVPFNEVWRLGANESTELEFYQDVTIGGKKVVKGKYSLFCIPHQQKWTIILNKGVDSWGAFSYNKSLDVLRTEIDVAQQQPALEYFTMTFDSTGNLVMMWDNLKASLPVKYSR